MTEQTSRLAIVLDSSGAEKQADSLTVALDKMTQSGDKAVTSIFKVTKATDEEKMLSINCEQLLIRLVQQLIPSVAAIVS